MNISKTAKEAASLLEKTILNERVEHSFELSNQGKKLLSAVGNESSVKTNLSDVNLTKIKTFDDFLNIKKGRIFIHNHPNHIGLPPLSFNDAFLGILFGYREYRAVSKNFCNLVEIPDMDVKKRMKCLLIPLKYKVLHESKTKYKQFLKKLTRKEFSFSEMIDYEKETFLLLKKMRKELEKVGGLKFRTIPSTPEAIERLQYLREQRKS